MARRLLHRLQMRLMEGHRMRLVTLTISLMLPLAAAAEIHKCRGADGVVRYTDQVCEREGMVTERTFRFEPRSTAPDPEPRLSERYLTPRYERYAPRWCVADDEDAEALARSCFEAWRWISMRNPGEATIAQSTVVERSGRKMIVVEAQAPGEAMQMRCPLDHLGRFDHGKSIAAAHEDMARLVKGYPSERTLVSFCDSRGNTTVSVRDRVAFLDTARTR